MTLTVVVGDVHACTTELEALLEQVRFVEGTDRLVLVGDVVVKGPDPHGALALARRLGATITRGNHEPRLLAWRQRGTPLGPEHERVARELSEEEWGILEEMPLWLDLPDHDVRVVHAGVPPGVPLKSAPAEALLTMRTVGVDRSWSDHPDEGPLWGTQYAGPPHVLFGHNARPEPQLHAWATGLDTGCVYGGRLSAVVLHERQRMPRGEAVRPLLRSVAARRKYAAGKPGRSSR
jgi:calcineurin-like phosphoesterase family protein